MKITDLSIVNIASLCFSTVDAPIEATPNKTPEPSPSLVIGTTLSIKEKKIPSILVYVMHANVPKDSDKMGVVKPQAPPTSAIDLDVYDFLFDEQSPDGLPIPTIPSTSTEPHPYPLKEGECPYVCSRHQIYKLEEFKVPNDAECTPLIDSIITVPNENNIVFSLRMELPDHVHSQNAAGAIGVFATTRINDYTVLDEKSLNVIVFNDVEDVVINMSVCQLSNGEVSNVVDKKQTFLLCVTRKGCLKVYDLPSLSQLSCYAIEGVVLSHVVSCDSTTGIVAIASAEGRIELIEISHCIGEPVEDPHQCDNILQSLKSKHVHS